ncbi:hypothetical protein BHE74_00016186 [Ensete ventricosum]|nr:hypothetical protein GW17_00014668 [Ensete ventricosum]RWW75774.1 hypothetical protein BHE74_00016186 [Ensete ventricosum]
MWLPRQAKLERSIKERFHAEELSAASSRSSSSSSLLPRTPMESSDGGGWRRMVMVLYVAVSMVGSGWCSKFDELVQPSWATDHVIYEGELLKLKLDNSSGAFPSHAHLRAPFPACLVVCSLMEQRVICPCFRCFRRWIRFQEQVSLRQGHCRAQAGGRRLRGHRHRILCMVSFLSSSPRSTSLCLHCESSWLCVFMWEQMSSDGLNHNEFDFEFLGNRTGEPYLVQTNLYINGVGDREQRMDLWFDPTADFHAYSILWNPRQVVFLVDDTPIRVFPNREDRGVAFPRDQAMGVYSSIWNADDWATEGGRVKTDWSHAPFVATFRGLRIDGCEWAPEAGGPVELRRCGGSGWGKEGRYWWKEKAMEALSVHQSHQLIWARANHLVYDYCNDPARFTTHPPECGK